MPEAVKVILTLDLSPVVINICITRRDSFVYGFLLEDANGPIDLTGSSFLHTVDTQADGEGSELFSIAEFNTLDTTGLVQFLPSVANLTQTPATYFHDVQWTNAASRIRTVINGSYAIGDDISD